MPAPTFLLPTTGSDPKAVTVEDFEAAFNVVLAENFDNIKDEAKALHAANGLCFAILDGVALTATSTGDPVARDDAAGTLIETTTYGRAFRVSFDPTPAVLSRRAVYPVKMAQVYDVRLVTKRGVAPSNPSSCEINLYIVELDDQFDEIARTQVGSNLYIDDTNAYKQALTVAQASDAVDVSLSTTSRHFSIEVGYEGDDGSFDVVELGAADISFAAEKTAGYAAALAQTSTELTTLHADVSAWITAHGETLTGNQIALLNVLVSRLDDAGIWEKLDLFGGLPGAPIGASRYDVKDPTVILTETDFGFAPWRGWFSLPDADGYIDLGVSYDALTQYTLNSAFIATYIGSDTGADTREMGQMSGTDTYLRGRGVAGTMQAKLNGGAAIVGLVATGVGFAAANYLDGDISLHKNGHFLKSQAATAVSVPTENIALGRGASTYSPEYLSFWVAGEGLTTSEHLVLFEAIQFYMLHAARAAIEDGAVSGSGGGSIPVAGETTTEMLYTTQDVSSSGGALTVDLAEARIFNIDLTEDIHTLGATNWPAGASSFMLRFTQDATGGHEVTFPAAWLTPGGGTLLDVVATADWITEYVVRSFDGGTRVQIQPGGAFDG